MRDVAEIVVPWVFLTLALFALVDWDESRLSPAELSRAWPPATRTLALAYFGLIALPVHFWRTRRVEGNRLGNLLARLVGWLWATAALLLDWVVSELVDRLPEAWLEAVMFASLAGFTVAMIWRSRRGGWWYQSARGH